MINTVIFDLGGVLFTNGSASFRRYLTDTYHIDEERVHEVMSGRLGSAYRSGTMDRKAFWTKFKEMLHITESPDELENRWQSGYQLIEETRDIILSLRKSYRVYYLSDNVKKRVDYLEEKYHFLRWFDGGVFSHETGTRKPDSKIYKLVLEKANVKPEESIYIDDKPEFLRPAKKLGMQTILFENPGQLEEDFRKLIPLR